MRIRINHIIQVDKKARKAVAYHLGKAGEKASIEEIKNFLEESGNLALEKAINTFMEEQK